MPSIPIPANGATGASNRLQLEWSRGTGATAHLLYFGDDHVAELHRSLARERHDVLRLSARALRTYYWRVDEQNAAGITAGPLWSFTTGAAAPSGPMYIAPANGATGVSLERGALVATRARGDILPGLFGLTNQTQNYSTTATTFTPPTLAHARAGLHLAGDRRETATGQGCGEPRPSAPRPRARRARGRPGTRRPRSGNQDVGFTPSLTFSAGQGAVQHDVYFGVGHQAHMSKVSTQSGTSYTPGPLLSEYAYYWRIDERDGQATSRPGKRGCSSPRLADGTPARAGQQPEPDRRQALRECAAHADLPSLPPAPPRTRSTSRSTTRRCGLPPRVAVLAPGTSSYTPGLLEANTRYVWFIGERNASGVRMGPTWSFTTGSTEGLVPEPATLPTPTNESIRIATNSSLSWTAGAGALSHDVYLGTSTSPPLVANVTTGSYQPVLQPYTTYYWRIDERNAAGCARGSAGAFPLALQPPPFGRTLEPEPRRLRELGQPHAHALLDGRRELELSRRLLRHRPGGNLPFAGNQTNSAYQPGNLSPSTTYYWRIVARNAAGVRQGPLWRFTTLSGLITLLSDNFEDGNATGWTVENTAWSIFTDGSFVYRATNTSGYARATAGSTSWTDQAVEARLKAISWNGSNRFALVGARFVDINNYYYVALRTNNTIELKRLVANAPTTLASKSLTFGTGTWYKVKLEAVGSTLRVYVDDVLQLTATDTTFASGKMVLGVWNGTAEFDDVLVTDP